MSRKFYDVGLKYPSTCDTRSFLEEVKRLGYKGLAFASQASPNEVGKIAEVCRKVGLDYVNRLDIVSSSASHIKALLRRYRLEVELIVVHPLSVEAARLAARDSRVDLLNFQERPELFEATEAKMMAAHNRMLEINLRNMMLRIDEPDYLKIVRVYRRMISLSQAFKVKLVISSGASSPLELRRPRDLASILHLLGFEGDIYDPLSKNPFMIIETNRAKLSGKIAMRGVWISDNEEA